MASPPNIYVVGAQSTGKTTLVNALIAYFAEKSSLETGPPAVIKEVARTVLKHHDFQTEEIRSTPARSLELQYLIQHAQLAAEQTALVDRTWFLSDRSGVDPMTYAARYVGPDAAQAMLASVDWKMGLEERMRRGVVLVCEPGADSWLANDGVRLMPHDWDDWIKTHVDFCRFLDSIGLRYVVLSHRIQDIRERVAIAVAAWNQARLQER